VKLVEHPKLRVAAAALCALGVKLLEPAPQVCGRISANVGVQRMGIVGIDRIEAPTSIHCAIAILSSHITGQTQVSRASLPKGGVVAQWTASRGLAALGR
jgi:hypothetical protein